MNLEQFKTRVSEIFAKGSWRSEASPFYRKPDLVGFRVTTGGVEGGSCWDSSKPTRYSSPENIPTLVPDMELLLLNIAEDLFPDISFITFGKIKLECVESFDDTEYEYYGNNTDYLYLKLDVDKLFCLVEGYIK